MPSNHSLFFRKIKKKLNSKLKKILFFNQILIFNQTHLLLFKLFDNYYSIRINYQCLISIILSLFDTIYYLILVLLMNYMALNEIKILKNYSYIVL
jgi:hypothetical protein